MELLLSAFITLMVIIDPPGNAAIFTALTNGIPAKEQRSIALNATLIATGTLVFFAFAGSFLLSVLEISMDAFKIAGGLLLFAIAFRMLMSNSDTHGVQANDASYANRSQIAVFPLAIPLIAGPGAITAVMLMMAQVHQPIGYVYVFGALALVQILTYLCMRLAGVLTRLMGNGGMMLITRMIGILLAALAVQFVIDGAGAAVQVLMIGLHAK